MKYSLRLSRQVVQDIAEVLAFTLEQFGQKQHAIYQTIIRDALKELAADPDHVRTNRRPEIHPEARTMHLARRGKHSRHVFLYRVVDNQFVDVARLLHDSMDLERHLLPDFETDD